MMTEIKVIECPKCGNTHKTILRPGDFRCASCGTEYFIDDGTVKFGQRPAAVGAAKPFVRSSGSQSVVIAAFLVIIVGSISLLVYLSSNDSKSTSANRSYSWDSGYENALYLSADKRPVLLTLGTKVDFGKNSARADYAAFIDASNNATIKTWLLPDAESLTNRPQGTEFDVRQFANGDIFVLVEKSQLFRVGKTAYALLDVSRSLFEGRSELVNGVAKLEFINQTEGQGFKLVTNDGKKYFYYPITHRISTKLLDFRPSKDPAKWAADTDQHTAFAFSMPYNSDFPDVPAQLISFGYRSYPDAPVMTEFTHYSDGIASSNRWDNPTILAEEGVSTHRDFTPGRNYFDYGVLYFDSDYLLISYRANPGKNAVRYVQLLDAKTAAIVFTSRFDVLYAPTECVRYKDGFAIVSLPDTYTLSMSGVLAKYTPFMFGK